MAAGVALAALAASLVVADVRPSAGTVGCTLEPVLHDFNVNQGLPYKVNTQGLGGGTPAYDPLTAGKTTIVRLYLSLPQCATGDAAIRVEKATTTVVLGGASAGQVSAEVNSPIAPELVPFSQAPAPASLGDVVFEVPGSVVANPGLTVFTAKVKYSAKPAGGTFGAPVEKTFQGSAVLSSTRTLRLLFVPMGDASSSNAFSDAAKANLEVAVQTMSRTLPLRDGVAELVASGSSAGLRRSTSPTMLDLGPNGLNLMTSSQGKLQFCGSGANFGAIAPKLAALLSKWNSDNPASPADRVVGVVDPAAASVGGACFLGIAEKPGSSAWFVAGSSFGGPALVHEVAHTWDLSRTSGGHSLNTTADGDAPLRGYNISTAQPLVDGAQGPSRSVLKVSDGHWNNNQVLAEGVDWRFTSCVLGGASTACVGSGQSVGAPAGAGPRIVVTGSVPHGASRVEVEDSYLSHNEDATTPANPADTRWDLVQVNSSGTVVSRLGIPLAGAPVDESGAGGAGPNASAGFRVSYDLDPAAARFQIRDSGEGDEIEFERTVDGTNEAPVITGADSGPPQVRSTANYTGSPADDTAAALSAAGLVAWNEGGTLVVASLADRSKKATVAAGATNAAWTRSGAELAYQTAGGSIEIVTVTVGADGRPVVAAERDRIYDATVAVDATAARHPSFSPDGQDVVVEVRQDLFVIHRDPGPENPLTCVLAGVTTGSCTQLTNTFGVGEIDPSWGPTGGRIVYTEGGTLVRIIDAATGQKTTLASGTQGSFGAERRVAFVRGGKVILVDPLEPAPRTEVVVSEAGQTTDARPSLHPTQGLVAFDRSIPGVPASQRDVMLAELSADGGAVELRVTALDDSTAPATELRAGFSIECGGAQYPLATGVAGTQLPSGEFEFRHLWNPGAFPSLPCAGGRFVYTVHDGAKSSDRVGELTGSPDARPTAAVMNPTDGALFVLGQGVALLGAASDAEGLASEVWTVQPPSDSPMTFSGGKVDYLPGVAGTYTATYTVTDTAGQAASDTTSFVVRGNAAPVPTITSPPAGAIFRSGEAVVVSGGAPDPDGDAVSLDWSVTGPGGFTARSTAPSFQVNPTATGVYDVTLTASDRYAGASATRTFRVADTAGIDYDPDSINVPPSSSDSSPVTVTITVAGRDLTQVDPASVRLTRIVTARSGTFDVSGEPWAALTGWSVKGKLGVDQHAKGLIDRTALANYLSSRPGWQPDQFVTITVVGAAPSWAFAGSDRIFAKKLS